MANCCLARPDCLVINFSKLERFMFFTLMFYADKSWYVCLAVTAIVAPVSTVVELVSRKGADTLTLPLSAAFVTFATVSVLPF